MKSWAAAILFTTLACLTNTPTFAQPAATSIWKNGGLVAGSCHVTVGHQVLMSGPCRGAGHGNAVTVTADKDGCTVDLVRKGTKVMGYLTAYRNVCGEIESEVQLGAFVQQGGCWVGRSARLCLTPRRGTHW